LKFELEKRVLDDDDELTPTAREEVLPEFKILLLFLFDIKTLFD